MAFWKFCWLIIEKGRGWGVVMQLFKEFHPKESFVYSLNATFLVLIPKKGGAEDMKDLAQSVLW